jgi:hypothetical protein
MEEYDAAAFWIAITSLRLCSALEEMLLKLYVLSILYYCYVSFIRFLAHYPFHSDCEEREF